jgi:hypothetical protein
MTDPGDGDGVATGATTEVEPSGVKEIPEAQTQASAPQEDAEADKETERAEV